MVTLKSFGRSVVCLQPNIVFLLLVIASTLQKSKTWSSSVEIILMSKTSKYHKLVLATELIFCNNPQCYTAHSGVSAPHVIRSVSRLTSDT